ncbi:glycosyltransferase family 2 protein [Cruoricaptor ignavus]|uniref:glycosyltransferase family 2 protein n=1 Tax=Cruoricaptor ignavus TaxID=1118202 RepID=UPI00370D6DBB
MSTILTIAIPFYNADKYLAEAIESVLAQTFKDWTLLLVNDGSTDNSLHIAQRYAEKDDRIKVLSDGENKNLGARLNEIADTAETKFLARMDADDIMHPDKLAKQLAVLESNPNIDVLGTNAYSINEIGEVVGIRNKYNGDGEIMKVDSFIHPTIMGKSSWFRNNKYDVNAVRIEDAELWLRTKDYSNFYCLTEPLFYYREFGDHYYKKYFKAFPSLLYLMKKPNKDKVVFSLKYILASFRCYVYYISGNEQKLIARRNEIIY